MSYIDNHLMDGENVVYRTKLHWIIFWGAILFLILALVAAAFFMMGKFDKLL